MRHHYSYRPFTDVQARFIDYHNTLIGARWANWRKHVRPGVSSEASRKLAAAYGTYTFRTPAMRNRRW